MNTLRSRLQAEWGELVRWLSWALRVAFSFFLPCAWSFSALLLMFQLHLLGLADSDPISAQLTQWSTSVPPIVCFTIVAIWCPSNVFEERA
jgi:hypothetical protein